MASRKGELSTQLPRYTHPDVLVVDEVGCLSYGTDAANMLFRVVKEYHLRGRPMIFTTNKHPTQWDGVLHDEDLATVIVDLILERGRLYHLDGPSMRTRRHRRYNQNRTEFPEFTGQSYRKPKFKCAIIELLFAKSSCS